MDKFKLISSDMCYFAVKFHIRIVCVLRIEQLKTNNINLDPIGLRIT